MDVEQYFALAWFTSSENKNGALFSVPCFAPDGHIYKKEPKDRRVFRLFETQLL